MPSIYYKEYVTFENDVYILVSKDSKEAVRIFPTGVNKEGIVEVYYSFINIRKIGITLLSLTYFIYTEYIKKESIEQ